MSIEYKEYHPHPKEPDNETSKIKFSVFYKKGEKYSVTVIPVKISKQGNFSTEEFGAYTGFNDTLLLCNRKSKKQLEAAINKLNENKQKYLDYFKY